MIARISNRIKNFFYLRGLKDRSLYTDQKQVMEELEKRRSLITDDSKLLEIIKPTPSIQRLIDKPHLVFFRQVATPLHETLQVVQLAKVLGLSLCILEFSADKMVGAQNMFKHGLGKMPVYQFIDKVGNDIIKNRTIIDFNVWSGHSIKSVKTIKNESLIEFHHELLTKFSDVKINKDIVDASDWFLQFELGASSYYEAFFTLFVKHNVLAEIFMIGNKHEMSFTRKVVKPAFLKVIQKHTFQPLIINYQPEDEQDRIYWDCYPRSVDDFLLQRGYIE